ncbi:MAG: carboxypeptidase-like regulatory domain-containing protein [Bacteroidetes bacterium]|nr:carboxypeptidase-like regulatory domain-containing protein [Bacteroidota bacterium]
MKIRYLLPLILFSILFSKLQAQQPTTLFTVKGKVLDESTQKPLEFATVVLKRLKDSTLVSGTITTVSGEFKITDLPPGGYSIEIAFIGYQKYTNRVLLKPQGSAPVNDLGVIK